MRLRNWIGEVGALFSVERYTTITIRTVYLTPL